MMVVPNAVCCTNREYVQWEKDLRVRWHQSLRFPYVLQLEFRRRIWDLLNTLVSLMAFTLCCLWCLTCPTDGFTLTFPAEASVSSRVWWCQDVQVYTVGWGASGVSVGPCCLPSSYVFPLQLTARHQQRYCLLSSVCTQSYQTFFSFHHFEVHSWVQLQCHKSSSSMTWSGIK